MHVYYYNFKMFGCEYVYEHVLHCLHTKLCFKMISCDLIFVVAQIISLHILWNWTRKIALTTLQIVLHFHVCYVNVTIHWYEIWCKSVYCYNVYHRIRAVQLIWQMKLVLIEYIMVPIDEMIWSESIVFNYYYILDL